MATIKDVAKNAGLSPAVVSKYLKDPDSVRENTRIRVERAIRELNYTPSLAARALRTHRTNMILVLVPQLEDRKINDLIIGLQLMASTRGFTLVLCTEDSLKEIYATTARSALSAYPVDGMLLCYPRDRALTQRFAAELDQIPCVVIGWPLLDNRSTYLWDVGESAYIVTKHLTDLGRKDIAFIGSQPHNAFFLTSFNRIERFRQALKDADAPLCENLMRFLPQDSAGRSADYFNFGVRTTRELLDSSHRPDAIVAERWDIALGCLCVIRDRHLRVPEDIAIVSCEDNASLQSSYPPITAAESPVWKTTEIAMNRLISEIESSEKLPVEQILPTPFETELHVRHSSDITCPAIIEQ